MGYKRKTTPTIDKMARNGLYFKNAIPCSIATIPSMFGATTGEYPLVESNNFNAEDWRREFFLRKTMAQSLLDRGYSTAAFNATAFFSFFGFSKGFECFKEFRILEEEKNWDDSAKLGRFFYHIRNILRKKDLAASWEDWYEMIIKWCQKVQSPFFLHIVLGDTHFPYLPPQKYRQWSSIFDILFANYLAYKGKGGPFSKNIFPRLFDATKAYDDSIYYADIFLKNLVTDLEEDDAIFIIHADHGEGFGEHGFYGHPPGYPVLFYEEFIHIPLVIYNAEVKGKIEEPVSLRGLPATILDLIGEGGKNDFSSESFLEGGKDWAICKVFDRGKRKVAVRMKDWKFMTGQKDVDELYNLEKDPREEENLIDEHPKFVEEMRNIVENHIKHEMEMRRIRDRALNLKIKNYNRIGRDKIK
jgi:arylsulfatase